ncbi:hypothetical protein CVT26_007179 [Gymnopilus dilepis]|uniref:Uncharacterized protein n=1 Tax=Gymnopilus dilepis TaxID=231916 RepID=A0A409W6K2_9AGAR|nr:hypothetical protein CVT26_007179 [Gymnopilus dilepis]
MVHPATRTVPLDDPATSSLGVAKVNWMRHAQSPSTSPREEGSAVDLGSPFPHPRAHTARHPSTLCKRARGSPALGVVSSLGHATELAVVSSVDDHSHFHSSLCFIRSPLPSSRSLSQRVAEDSSTYASHEYQWGSVTSSCIGIVDSAHTLRLSTLIAHGVSAPLTRCLLRKRSPPSFLIMSTITSPFNARAHHFGVFKTIAFVQPFIHLIADSPRVCSTDQLRHVRTPLASFERAYSVATRLQSSSTSTRRRSDLTFFLSSPQDALEVFPLARVTGGAYIDLGNLILHGGSSGSSALTPETDEVLETVLPHLLDAIAESDRQSQHSTWAAHVTELAGASPTKKMLGFQPPVGQRKPLGCSFSSSLMISSGRRAPHTYSFRPPDPLSTQHTSFHTSTCGMSSDPHRSNTTSSIRTLPSPLSGLCSSLLAPFAIWEYAILHLSFLSTGFLKPPLARMLTPQLTLGVRSGRDGGLGSGPTSPAASARPSCISSTFGPTFLVELHTAAHTYSSSKNYLQLRRSMSSFENGAPSSPRLPTLHPSTPRTWTQDTDAQIPAYTQPNECSLKPRWPIQTPTAVSTG